MGDRVTVTVTILESQKDGAEEILQGADETNSGDGFVAFVFHEVNYANLEGAEDELTQTGIAWTKHWQQGGEFREGHEHVRFTEAGEKQYLEVYMGAENPTIQDLLKLKDNPDELVKYITQFAADNTPLSWDNQEEYGRRYLARQTITE